MTEQYLQLISCFIVCGVNNIIYSYKKEDLVIIKTDRIQDSLRNKSSVGLDYIELRTRLNQFGMFVEH